jgi:hypothetical protein
MKLEASLFWEGWVAVIAELVNRTIFDPKLAQRWSKIKKRSMWYNDSTAYIIIHSAQQIEKQAKATEDCK